MFVDLRISLAWCDCRWSELCADRVRTLVYHAGLAGMRGEITHDPPFVGVFIVPALCVLARQILGMAVRPIVPVLVRTGIVDHGS